VAGYVGSATGDASGTTAVGALESARQLMTTYVNICEAGAWTGEAASSAMGYVTILISNAEKIGDELGKMAKNLAGDRTGADPMARARTDIDDIINGRWTGVGELPDEEPDGEPPPDEEPQEPPDEDPPQPPPEIPPDEGD
jgi:hypothetical protein